MKIYEITYQNFHKTYVGRSRASAIHQFKFSETFEHFKEYFGEETAEKFYEALLIGVIRDADVFLKCLGDINKNRNLAKKNRRKR